VAERLRALLERPLDPHLARAVVALAGTVTLGFAALGLLAGGGADHGPLLHPHPPGSGRPAVIAPPARALGLRKSTSPQQDPQDRPGSVARRRAERELATHRAFQHVPYRRGGVAIDLVGAHGDRAVLAVWAASRAAAHRGWHAFLRRYRDDGRAYIPVFRARGDRRG
jgi:hypothetical protein